MMNTQGGKRWKVNNFAEQNYSEQMPCICDSVGGGIVLQNKSSIVLNMNLNASGFARGIKSVIGSVKNMNESMKDATNTASKMSSVMKGIGSSAIKVGKGLAVAGAAAATAVTALDFKVCRCICRL